MGLNVSKIQMILQELVSGTTDLEGAALVTPDGLPLVTTLPSNMDEERVAAMSAAMLSLGERISDELNRGKIEKISVEGQQGHCVLASCGDDAVLLVLANQAAKQGILTLAIKQAVTELKLAMM
ncbi:MAG: diacylglyceryl transferase [Leptolyngbya sp. SIO4C1]|nr:diacylglyceryl transferase [Leptolyngbya sp. SIO4C1]